MRAKLMRQAAMLRILGWVSIILYAGQSSVARKVASCEVSLQKNPASEPDEDRFQVSLSNSPASSPRDVRWRLNRWKDLSESVSSDDQKELERYLQYQSRPKWARWSLSDMERRAIETFIRDRESHARSPNIQMLPQLVSGLEKVRWQNAASAGPDSMYPYVRAWEEINNMVVDSDLELMRRFIAEEKSKLFSWSHNVTEEELIALDSFLLKRKGIMNSISLSNLEELTSGMHKFYSLHGEELEDEQRAASGLPKQFRPWYRSSAIATKEGGTLLGVLVGLAAASYAGHRIWRKNRTDKRTWRVVEVPQKIGDLELHADGRFSIGGISWNQGSSIGHTQFGSLSVHKKAGVNQTLTIQEGRSTTKLVFDGENWKMLC